MVEKEGCGRGGRVLPHDETGLLLGPTDLTKPVMSDHPPYDTVKVHLQDSLGHRGRIGGYLGSTLDTPSPRPEGLLPWVPLLLRQGRCRSWLRVCSYCGYTSEDRVGSVGVLSGVYCGPYVSLEGQVNVLTSSLFKFGDLKPYQTLSRHH